MNSKFSFAAFIFGALLGFALVASLDARADTAEDVERIKQCVSIVKTDMAALGMEAEAEDPGLLELSVPDCVDMLETLDALNEVVYQIAIQETTEFLTKLYRERANTFRRSSAKYGMTLGQLFQTKYLTEHPLEMEDVIEEYDDTVYRPAAFTF